MVCFSHNCVLYLILQCRLNNASHVSHDPRYTHSQGNGVILDTHNQASFTLDSINISIRSYEELFVLVFLLRPHVLTAPTRLSNPSNLHHISFVNNGTPFYPKWRSPRILSSASILLDYPNGEYPHKYAKQWLYHAPVEFPR